MKKLLVLCPTHREYRDLPRLAQALGYEIVFDEFCGDYFDVFLGKHPPADRPRLDILSLIDDTVARYEDAGLAGVTSGVGYPGMSAASIIARRLGLPGPSPESVLRCEHKYYSRVAQKRYVPEAVPAFHLLDPAQPEAARMPTHYPAFLKPVKGCMSINAHRVDDAAELQKLAQAALLPDGFVGPFNDMMKAYTRYPLSASYLLVESLMEGMQVSLEGCVYRGEVHVMGILDAILFPGSLSFRRFQYPSRLPGRVQAQMESVARQVMSGLGYDNAPFNIEMFYDERTDRVQIIEINPKIASQFADLLLKVDGHSSFGAMLQLAAGERPWFRRGEGEFRVSATCVLRTFEDQHVLSVPAQDTIESIVSEYPQAIIEIHATPGRNLSDQMQDAQSFRYGLVNIGANSETELEESFRRIAERLDREFEFAPATQAAPCAVHRAEEHAA